MPRGDAELWKPVPDLAGYEASNLGRIRSVRRGVPQVLTATQGPCGFATVTVSPLAGPGGSCRRVGTLVAAAWLGPCPPGEEVRRLDGDPLNDRADNLAYGPQSEDLRARIREYHAKWHRTHYQRRKPPVTTCIDCNAPVQQNTGPGAPFKRCDPCRAEAQRESYRRYRAKSAKAPRLSYCIDCGTKILNTGPGPKALRCVPHRMLAARAADQRYRDHEPQHAALERRYRTPRTTDKENQP